MADNISPSEPHSEEVAQIQQLKSQVPIEPPELTARALGGGVLVGGMLCFSNMYFGLQTGWVTMGSLQSALLGFGMFKLLGPYLSSPFTAKENVVLQTTAVAVATMPLCGGFVGIIPAFRLLSSGDDGNENTGIGGEGPIELSIMELLGWSFALGFFGVFMAPPLRRQTILREKLPFPSGTATAEIIRQLHGIAKKELRSNKKDDDHHLNHHAGESESDDVELVDEMTVLIHSESDRGNFSAHPMEASQALAPSNAPPPAWRLLFICFAISAIYTLVGNFVPILKNIPIGT